MTYSLDSLSSLAGEIVNHQRPIIDALEISTELGRLG
jgi:hypothetical protein